MSGDSLAPQVLQRLRWRLLANAWKQWLELSLLRPMTILISSLLMCLFVFVVSYAGFRALDEVFHIPLDGQIIESLVGLMFFVLGGLLIFSTGLILYGSLFAAAESAFLLSTPARADHVFAYKLQGAMAFSSWAFLLLGAPVLVAYGLVARSPWYFYASLPLYFLGYVLMPGSVAAVACLLLVNFAPRRRRQFVVLALAATALLVVWWAYTAIAESRRTAQSSEPAAEAANVLLARIAFAANVWLPSAWVSRGVLAVGRGDLAAHGYYLALVWSNGLFLYLLATTAAVRLYRRGYNRVVTGGDLRRKHGGAWMDRLLSALLPFVHPGTRLLIVKDFRTFRRDPQQWGQVLLFTVLLAIYFSNIRRMFVRDIQWSFQNGISLLNLISVALLLSAYTGRFIYPLLSLEGRKFWILGLLPLRREQIVWGKFAFATAGGVVLAGLLVLLSDLMLEIPWDGIVVHLLAVSVLAAGLSGISVGLGACLPNFRESDPSKIAVGFGGTVNLVVELLFVVVVLGLMAGPWHLMRAAGPDATPSLLALMLLVLCGLVGLVFGAVGVLLPLQAGIRALKRMEF